MHEEIELQDDEKLPMSSSCLDFHLMVKKDAVFRIASL